MNSPSLPPPRPRTLRFILPGVALLAILGSFPSLRETISAFDVRVAYHANGMLTHWRAFDLFIARLNSQAGDAFVLGAFLTFFLVHSLLGPDRAERARRFGFWLWVGVTFLFVYGVQHFVEDIWSRRSPSKALLGLSNLGAIYHLKTKTVNMECFPSGHASSYYFFAFMALRRYRQVGFSILALAVLLPTTRLITGAHWFSDIVFGSIPMAALASALVMETPLRRGEPFLVSLFERYLPGGKPT